MRWQDSGLALLAVVAAVLVALTFRGGPVEDPATPAASGPLDGPVAATADVASGTVGGDGAGADDAAATSSPEPYDEDAALEAARAVLAGPDPVVVAALGDSTGNETWEWVYGWGRLLGADRPVSVTSWNEWAEDGYIEPRLLSDAGDGSPVRILSGQQTGAGAGYVADHLDALLPEPVDLVLLSYGHEHTVADAREEMEGALSAVRSATGPGVPVVVVLQQPEVGDRDADVREEIRALAEEEGLGVVDVAAAFAAAGDPDELLADDVHPDEEGSQVWARAVVEALGAP